MTPTNRGGLLTTDELADYLGVPKATLYAWSYRGEGPRALKIGRHLRYRADDVEEWLESCESARFASGPAG